MIIFPTRRIDIALAFALGHVNFFVSTYALTVIDIQQNKNGRYTVGIRMEDIPS